MKRLPAFLSFKAIKDVWGSSRDARIYSAGAPGVDRIRASVFSAQLQDNINQIRSSLQNEEFKFKKLRLAPVQKPSGGYRIIAIPTVADRLVQRAVLRHLEADKKFKGSSAISYGFTKGRKLADAQRQALLLRKEYPWVLQADIIKFFDCIDRKIIKNLIRKNVRSRIIQEILINAVDCELDDGDGGGAKIVLSNGIQKGLGLRQGMPVSPVLSNLLLKGFDDLLNDSGIRVIRYADDIAIFSEKRQGCVQALSLIRSALSKLNLRIPELEDDGKTKISEPSEPVEFLGVEIKRFSNDYKLCAPNKKLDKIELEMIKIISISKCIKEKKNIGHIVRSLDSFVIGHLASMQVLDDPDSFRNRLESMRQRHLMSFLAELIGAPAANKLDDSQLAILGVKPFRGSI